MFNFNLKFKMLGRTLLHLGQLLGAAAEGMVAHPADLPPGAIQLYVALPLLGGQRLAEVVAQRARLALPAKVGSTAHAIDDDTPCAVRARDGVWGANLDGL